jgi:hypothetical protein
LHYSERSGVGRERVTFVMASKALARQEEEIRFAPDSPLEGTGFEPVWGFSCQVVVFGLLPVLCSERERPFFVPSPAIRFAERAEGVKGPKR